MQQWRSLRARGIKHPNPRRQMLDDLHTFIQPKVAAGHEILVTIDANSAPDDSTITDFLDTTALFDLHSDFLPDHPPATYQRGRHKIDHIWGTLGILHATTNAGILPFGSGPRSDHTILFADINLATLTELQPNSLHDPTHPASRNLWSTDIKAAEKYIDLVRDAFHAENIIARIATLVNRCDRTQKCTPNDEKILNKIDSDITNILLSAEIKCKKAKGHAWSPLLANAGRTVIAAKWHLSDLLNSRLVIPLWDRAQAIIDARQQVKDAYALLRQIQCDARQIRDSFLEDRATHLAETRNMDKAQAIRQLLQAERQALTFRKLGKWLKGREHIQLDRVLTPDTPTDLLNTTWTAVVEAQALYEVLTHDGQTHFHQAADTPFVTGPIADKLGPFADNHYCEAILQGTFDLSNLEATTEVKDIIRGMQYPYPSNPTPSINTTISLESFNSTITHTRESTSSSPSGQHYGHYHTLLHDPDLLDCISSIANFCFQWGVSLTRWEKCTQPLIPKDPGVPRITRLRRIALLEADLNVCLSDLFG
jgi:hypothetical protein